MTKKFQFQNGSINRLYCVRSVADGVQFQFQNGSINRKKKSPCALYLYCFNSKMVRLIGYPFIDEEALD